AGSAFATDPLVACLDGRLRPGDRGRTRAEIPALLHADAAAATPDSRPGSGGAASSDLGRRLHQGPAPLPARDQPPGGASPAVVRPCCTRKSWSSSAATACPAAVQWAFWR